MNGSVPNGLVPSCVPGGWEYACWIGHEREDEMSGAKAEQDGRDEWAVRGGWVAASALHRLRCGSISQSLLSSISTYCGTGI